MTQYNIDQRGGLPTEMQTLLREYPRDAWPDHPNFARSIQNWMSAHSSFRSLAGVLVEDTETFADRAMASEDYAGRLGFYGDLLLRNLHGHHTWEDRSYFPELMAADGRFETGLDMLESDHVALDALLDRIGRTGNRVVQLSQLEPSQMVQEVGPMHDDLTQLQGFLARHLEDEEDLIVPILLHHKMRG